MARSSKDKRFQTFGRQACAFRESRRALFWTSILVVLSLGSTARALNLSEFETDYFGQAIVRPEMRDDRPTGSFHESRLRLFAPLNFTLESEKSTSDSPNQSHGRSPHHFSMGPQLGSYLLNEWSLNSQASHIVSPYLGWTIRDQRNWLENGWPLVTQIQLSFEGRFRQILGGSHDSTKSNGWDPRTNLSAGAWYEFAAKAEELWALDAYAELGTAPRFSRSGYGASSVRVLRRSFLTPFQHKTAAGSFCGPSGRCFVDASLEWMLQETATLELGARRQELRTGLAFGWVSAANPKTDGLSLRLTHGWPLLTTDVRSRWEALLTLGVGL